MSEDEQKYYEELATRASTYSRYVEPEKPLTSCKLTLPRRNSMFLKCQEHNPLSKKNDNWKPENAACQSCFVFNPKNMLPNCVLPTHMAIIQLLLHHKESKTGSAEWFVTCDIALHWIFCNVYPTTTTTIEKKVAALYTEFSRLKGYVHNKKGEKYWKDYEIFTGKLSAVMKVRADDSQTKKQEKFWNCKMCEQDKTFYKLQCENPPTGYCENFVDSKWKKTRVRKLEREDRSRLEYYEFVHDDSMQDVEDTCENDSTYMEPEETSKKMKYEYEEVIDNDNDELPYKFRHIRTKKQRSVRPEVYQIIAKMKSKYHMSQAQAEGAIVEVANGLFNRNWKVYDKHSPTNRDTLPAGSNMRRVEPYIEAMALSSIVEEIMSGENMVVAYSNDGSAMSGVGNYVVQSFTVNKVQRVLPTFSIFIESRDSLKELELMTLKMLSAATGFKYTEQDILSNITFVMTDSTSHNLEVMESVCEDFNVKAPKALTCNIHPLMMMQRKVKEVFRLLHDMIGADKVKECFLTDIDLVNDDFITKSITCLTNFINKDHSAKPWNRQSHFDNFIKPRKNLSITLKDHRFNRIFECCESLVYHVDDIANYLDRYRNIVNGISILDRSFVEMPILKPIFSAVSLIGIHITKPFQQLLIDVDTNYSKLVTAFPKLYEELKDLQAIDLCSTSIQVMKFVSPEIFKSCIPDKAICKAIDESIQMYSDQIVPLMKLIVSKIADGFDVQRGAIFGFGTHANDDTGSVFNVSKATEDEMKELDKTSVHNLSEERSVGSVNNELRIRGKRNLESVSRKLVLNKSFDLIEKKSPEEYRRFRKPAQAITSLKVEWRQKMKVMEEDAFIQKESINSHIDSIKYRDLEFLKSVGGPFTKAEEVQEYMDVTEESKEMNKRLYVEVRYAKNSSLRLKHIDPLFRLKRANKNLLSSEYAENLIKYLGNARKTTTISVNDLSDAINKITGVSIAEELDETAEIDESVPKPGEHVAVFWIEGAKDVAWYMGIVDVITEDKEVRVILLKKTDKQGQHWYIPEEIDVWKVDADQIIARNIDVIYHGASLNRVELSKATVKEICDIVHEIQEGL